jgi:cell division protein FtsQ
MSTSSWVRSDSRRLPELPQLHSRKLKVLLALLTVVLVGGLGWLWYRGSSFVKIRRVSVVGLSGPDIPQIRSALEQSALTMTTLNVQMSKLDAAVSEYPAVHSLTVTTEGDHGLLIRVNEQVPVALVTSNGELVAVDGAGQLLSQSSVPHGVLPTLPLAPAPGSSQITAAGTLSVLQVLQAAPYQWLGHIQSAVSTAAHGVVLQLRRGPEVYFGPPNQLTAKWAALSAVLENSGSAGAQYIDVSDPQRPAAGVNPTRTTTGTSTTATATTTAITTATTTAITSTTATTTAVPGQ